MNKQTHPLSAEGDSTNPLSHLRSILLRGGRLRKTARGVLTYAPFMGLTFVSAV